MALLLLDSFDHYATADITQKWTVGGGSLVPATHGNGVGTPTMRMGLAPGDSTMIIGGSVRIGAGGIFFMPVDELFAPFFKAAALLTGNDGTIRTSGDFNGVFGVSAPNLWKAGGTYYIWSVVTNLNSSSAGTHTVYVDGVEVISITGLDFMGGFTGSALGWSGMQIGRLNPDIVVDDLIVMDGVDDGTIFHDVVRDGNNNPAAIEIVVKRPNAVGDLTEWIPVPVQDNWENVDDPTPDGDVTYNYALGTAVGARDLYHIEDLAPDESLLGAQLLVNGRRSGLGAALIAPITKQAGTIRDGTTVGLASSYTYASRVPFGAAPDGSAWSRAIFNDIQVGQKRIS